MFLCLKLAFIDKSIGCYKDSQAVEPVANPLTAVDRVARVSVHPQTVDAPRSHIPAVHAPVFPAQKAKRSLILRQRFCQLTEEGDGEVLIPVVSPREGGRRRRIYFVSALSGFCVSRLRISVCAYWMDARATIAKSILRLSMRTNATDRSGRRDPLIALHSQSPLLSHRWTTLPFEASRGRCNTLLFRHHGIS